MKLRTINKSLALNLELLTLNLILLTFNQLPTFPSLKLLSKLNIKKTFEWKENNKWQWQLRKISCHVWYLYSINQRGGWRYTPLSLCPSPNFRKIFAKNWLSKFCRSKVPYYKFGSDFLPPVGHVLING